MVAKRAEASRRKKPDCPKAGKEEQERRLQLADELTEGGGIGGVCGKCSRLVCGCQSSHQSDFQRPQTTRVH